MSWHDPVQRCHEIDEVMRPAELAICDGMQSRFFLQSDGIANRRIFENSQFSSVDFAFFSFCTRITKCRRPKQTAHVVGTKRRRATASHDYCSRPGISASAR